MAGSLGYCGLDRRRQPLTGDEIRACWEAAAGGAGAPLVASTRTTDDEAPPPGRPAPLEFIEVHGLQAAQPPVASIEPAGPDLEATAPSSDSPAFVPPPLPPAGEPGWSLWGDPDR